MADDPTSWQACVGSRPHPLNVEDASFAGNPAPGVVNTVGWPDCASALTPMTVENAAVKSCIAAIAAGGETCVPGGLSWAQALISSELPFTEGMSCADLAAQGAVEASVLMTDGENAASPDGGARSGADKAQADGCTLEPCGEIKPQGVILYTILLDVSDAGTEAKLKSRASGAAALFDPDDPNELMAACGEIGDIPQELALVK
jgi:hypothetical protein